MPLHFLEQCKHLSNLNKMQLFVLLVMSVFPGSVKLLILWEFFSTKILGVDLPPPPLFKNKASCLYNWWVFCFCIILTRDINDRNWQLILIYVSVLTLYSVDMNKICI